MITALTDGVRILSESTKKSTEAIERLNAEVARLHDELDHLAKPR